MKEAVVDQVLNGKNLKAPELMRRILKGVQWSNIGKAVLSKLETISKYKEGTTWMRGQGEFESKKWLLNTPLTDPEFIAMEAPDRPEIRKPDVCDPDKEEEIAEVVENVAVCDSDFHILMCQNDADCSTGICREIDATVTKVGEKPKKLCVGASDETYERYYEAIIQAEQFLDISVLAFNGISWG